MAKSGASATHPVRAGGALGGWRWVSLSSYPFYSGCVFVSLLFSKCQRETNLGEGIPTRQTHLSLDRARNTGFGLVLQQSTQTHGTCPKGKTKRSPKTFSPVQKSRAVSEKVRAPPPPKRKETSPPRRAEKTGPLRGGGGLDLRAPEAQLAVPHWEPFALGEPNGFCLSLGVLTYFCLLKNSPLLGGWVVFVLLGGILVGYLKTFTLGGWVLNMACFFQEAIWGNDRFLYFEKTPNAENCAESNLGAF